MDEHLLSLRLLKVATGASDTATALVTLQFFPGVVRWFKRAAMNTLRKKFSKIVREWTEWRRTCVFVPVMK